MHALISEIAHHPDTCLAALYQQNQYDQLWPAGKTSQLRELTTHYKDLEIIGPIEIGMGQALPEGWLNDSLALSLLGEEVLSNYLAVGLMQAILRAPHQDTTRLTDICLDSSRTALFKELVMADDIQSAIQDVLPPEMSERISWLEQFHQSDSLQFAGVIIPVCKPDSLECKEAVREALQELGYLNPIDSLVDTNSFQMALMSFQYRHGLEPDGVIGKRTREAFSRSDRERYRQIVANLARARDRQEWLKGELYIEVNVPEQILRVYENEMEIASHKVIVGVRAKTETPSFKASMSEIVINPLWNVPYSISTEELLPKQQDDSTYLVDHHYKVYNRQNEEEDPATLDWYSYDVDYFPYRIVQDAGPWNALGTIKFLFPNRHAVYIHDTPSRHLFAKSERDFSHGCIRVDRPYELAELLFDRRELFEEREAFYAALDTASDYSVIVHPKIPVWVTYNSVRKDSIGELIFYRDIYKRDGAQ